MEKAENFPLGHKEIRDIFFHYLWSVTLTEHLGELQSKDVTNADNGKPETQKTYLENRVRSH